MQGRVNPALSNAIALAFDSATSKSASPTSNSCIFIYPRTLSTVAKKSRTSLVDIRAAAGLEPAIFGARPLNLTIWFIAAIFAQPELNSRICQRTSREFRNNWC